MNTTKKIVALILSLVLVICATVFVTIAYFTDETETVENTFTVGKVKISLDEALVNENGEPVDADGEVVEDPQDAERVIQNGYDSIAPGLTYTKDPTVTVEGGSNPCYVRAFITLTEADAFLEIYEAHDKTLDDILGLFSFDEAVWEPLAVSSEDIVDGELTIEFRYVVDDGIVPKSDEDTVLDPVITTVTLPGWITSDDAAEIPNGFEVNVIAQAIQSAGFDSADAAWAAFDAE